MVQKTVPARNLAEAQKLLQNKTNAGLGTL